MKPPSEPTTNPLGSAALAALSEDEFAQLLAQTRQQARAAGYLLVAPVYCRACEGGNCEHCHRIAGTAPVCDCPHPGQEARDGT